MKFLILMLVLTSCFEVHAGYTKEHIQKSCEKYHQGQIRKIQAMSAYISGNPAQFMDFYLMVQGLKAFDCEDFIVQLEEDYK